MLDGLTAEERVYSDGMALGIVLPQRGPDRGLQER